MRFSALSSRRVLVGVSSCAVLMLAGCAFSGGGGSTALSPVTGSSGVRAMGVAHGGFNAIYGATVTLYGMNTGSTIYGDTPVTLATTTTAANGQFGFTRDPDGSTPTVAGHYACPTPGTNYVAGDMTDPEVYVVLSGGDSSGLYATNAPSTTPYNNTFIKLIGVYGDCQSLTTAPYLTINELSTAATVVAMQQFLNPATEAIGAPAAATAPTALQALKNAIATIGTLAIPAEGVAQQSVTPTSSVPGITMTVTPEFQKLNTIANILAACVGSNPAGTPGASPSNANPANCAALQANAIPPASWSNTNFSSVTSIPTSAGDVLQAVDFMFVNPTASQSYSGTGNKVAKLFALPTTSSAPFSPALASNAQPMDWTIGINYVPTGTCTGVYAKSTAYVSFLLDTYSVAVDAAGNVWAGGGSSNPYNALVEMSPTGNPMKCLTSVPATKTGNKDGQRIAFDNRGNVWWATGDGLLEYVTDTTNSKKGTFLTWPLPSFGNIAGLAADQNGNIFASPEMADGSTIAGSNLVEYPAVSQMTAPFAKASIVSLGSVAMTVSSSTMYRDVAISRTGGNLSTENTVAYASGTPNVFYYPKQQNGTWTVDAGLSGVTGDATTYGMASLSDGTSVTGDSCCTSGSAGQLFQFNPATGAFVSASSAFAGGTNAVRAIAVDGKDNIWLSPSQYAVGTINSTAAGGLAEVDKNYNAISPQGTTPSPCNSTNGCLTNGTFEKSIIDPLSTYAFALDGSGNVWGSPDTTTTHIYEIVGQAVPVQTPLVATLQ